VADEKESPWRLAATPGPPIRWPAPGGAGVGAHDRARGTPGNAAADGRAAQRTHGFDPVGRGAGESQAPGRARSRRARVRRLRAARPRGWRPAARRVRSGAAGLGGAQDLLGLVDHTGFVGVGESAQGFADGEPLDDVVLAVVVGGVAADHLHQVEVDRLRVAYAAPHKPVVDLVQRPLDLHQQAGLFAHLADGGAFEGLAHLGCAFGQRPAARANASDECHLDRPTLRLATVDHPAGGALAPRRPPITLAAASVRQPRGSGTCWSIRRAAARGYTGALSSLSTPPTPPRPSHR